MAGLLAFDRSAGREKVFVIQTMQLRGRIADRLAIRTDARSGFNATLAFARRA